MARVDNILNILKKMKIVQVKNNVYRSGQGLDRLGLGFDVATRINPFNPASYVFICVMFIVIAVLYGVEGLLDEDMFENPFKWR